MSDVNGTGAEPPTIQLPTGLPFALIIFTADGLIDGLTFEGMAAERWAALALWCQTQAEAMLRAKLQALQQQTASRVVVPTVGVGRA